MECFTPFYLIAHITISFIAGLFIGWVVGAVCGFCVAKDGIKKDNKVLQEEIDQLKGELKLYDV